MSTEYLQFAGALVLFLGILIGSYWFVYVPNRGGSGSDERDGARRIWNGARAGLRNLVPARSRR